MTDVPNFQNVLPRFIHTQRPNERSEDLFDAELLHNFVYTPTQNNTLGFLQVSFFCSLLRLFRAPFQIVLSVILLAWHLMVFHLFSVASTWRRAWCPE
jgi:hypothetical protein